MGLFNQTSKSTKNTTNNNTAVNTYVDGDSNNIFANSSGNTLTVTDFNAVNRSFDAFDGLIKSAESQSKSALKAVTENTDKTTAALKDFATSLTVGDIQSAKWIASGIIAAVMIVLIVYFVWG